MGDNFQKALTFGMDPFAKKIHKKAQDKGFSPSYKMQKDQEDAMIERAKSEESAAKHETQMLVARYGSGKKRSLLR